MKTFIRKIYIKKRNELSAEFIIKVGESMLETFKNSKLYNKNYFMVYYPIKNEAPINYITEKLLETGKTVALPTTLSDDNLSPVNFTDFKMIVKGKYNIPEPSEKAKLNTENLDVVFVPGVAFDKSGGRVGYGKGCYDRFLSDKNVIKIGVCYEFQILEETIYMDKHDIRMDYLLTEKAIYEVKL